MDEKEQAAGENRVQKELIDPLLKLGLTKPGGLRKAVFEDMLKELRQKLAYMTDGGLRDLREWCEEHPGGVDGDRFPIALKVLKKARQLEQPEAGPSPLVLKVFRHEVGQNALAKGYAPELLKYLLGSRKWPSEWALTHIKKDADDPIRWLEDIELRMARGEEVSDDKLRFRDQRLVALRKCQDIADEAQGKRLANAEAGA